MKVKELKINPVPEKKIFKICCTLVDDDANFAFYIFRNNLLCNR